MSCVLTQCGPEAATGHGFRRSGLRCRVKVMVVETDPWFLFCCGKNCLSSCKSPLNTKVVMITFLFVCRLNKQDMRTATLCKAPTEKPKCCNSKETRTESRNSNRRHIKKLPWDFAWTRYTHWHRTGNPQTRLNQTNIQKGLFHQHEIKGLQTRIIINKLP